MERRCAADKVVKWSLAVWIPVMMRHVDQCLGVDIEMCFNDPMKEKPVIFIGGLEDILDKHLSIAGRRLSIASRTPHGVNPDGKVEALVPRAEDVWLFNKKEISLDEFRRRYVEWIENSRAKLSPGKLSWNPFSFFSQDDVCPVEAGDFLFCTCIKACGQGLECHRLWAARLLSKAGWLVNLDGKVFHENKEGYQEVQGKDQEVDKRE